MKRTIRLNVFETNSSSVHSMVIRRERPLLPDDKAYWYEDKYYRELEDDEEVPFEPNTIPISKKGTIWGDFGSFGRNYEIFNSQEEKLSYLLTLCYYANDCDFDRFLESQHFDTLESAVCKYTGAKQIRFSTKVENKIRKSEERYDDGYASIDHQSAPYNGDIEFIDIYDYDAIVRFIWGKGVCLRTSSD